MAYAICQIFEQKKLIYSVFLKSKNEFRLRYMWFQPSDIRQFSFGSDHIKS